MPNTTGLDWLSAALEGEPDLLTPLAAKDKEYLRSLSCPKCGGGGILREVNPLRPFAAHDMLPKWDGRCPACKCLFSATTGVIIEG